ncbi:hypothetical protein [Enterocloster citroniae]|uniref:hypothetical protein n=1 Tax=Enterocloster citroniae TaxID=358743 RepID=UPI001897BE11|nr:hypothetical protein [Enterocloster citroniae]
MIAHEVYALIYDEMVQSVCVAYSYEDANRVARAVYGDDAFAIDCLYCPCQEGDTYIDGSFYAPDGTVRPWLPTQEQHLAQMQTECELLRQENQEMTMVLADMIGGAM